VRTLLAHVPTFLMFDDHEVTDDWNFDLTWVQLLHNRGDAFQMWPKTMTDMLAAYWVYQGWGNKAPSQWAQWMRKGDPRQKGDLRTNCLARAQRIGVDALPELRRLIHQACFTPRPPAEDPKTPDPRAHYQAGTGLDWHYRLPFDPPFLVPDCRSRKFLVQGDEKLRVIDHESSKALQSQTIDDAQLDWMRKILLEWRGGPAAFIAPSTPLLLQKKVMSIMQTPEVAAAADRGKKDVATWLTAYPAALFESTALGIATDALLRVFRRRSDLEHMIRDRSWRDLWSMVAAMHKNGSPVKTLVLVSGDVHHSYNMTANLPAADGRRPSCSSSRVPGCRPPPQDVRPDVRRGAGQPRVRRGPVPARARLCPEERHRSPRPGPLRERHRHRRRDDEQRGRCGGHICGRRRQAHLPIHIWTRLHDARRTGGARRPRGTVIGVRKAARAKPTLSRPTSASQHLRRADEQQETRCRLD
jgi:hypothetical protein